MIQLNTSRLSESIVHFIANILGFTRQAQSNTIDIIFEVSFNINPPAIRAAVISLVRYVSNVRNLARLRKSLRQDEVTQRIERSVFFQLLEFLYFYQQNMDSNGKLSTFALNQYFIERPGKNYPLFMHILFDILRSNRKFNIYSTIIAIVFDIKINKEFLDAMLADNFLGDNIVGIWKQSSFQMQSPIADFEAIVELAPGLVYLPYNINSEPGNLHSFGNVFLTPGANNTTNFLALRNAILDDTDRAFALAFFSTLYIRGIPGMDNPLSEFYQVINVVGNQFTWDKRPLTDVEDNSSLSISPSQLSVHIIQIMGEIMFGVSEISHYGGDLDLPSQGGNKPNGNSSGPTRGMNPPKGPKGTKPSPKSPTKPFTDIDIQPSNEELSTNNLKPTDSSNKSIISKPKSTVGRKISAGEIKSFPIDITEIEQPLSSIVSESNRLRSAVNRGGVLFNKISQPVNTAISYLTSGNVQAALNTLNVAVNLFGQFRSNQQSLTYNVQNVNQNSLTLQATLEQRLGVINL